MSQDADFLDPDWRILEQRLKDDWTTTDFEDLLMTLSTETVRQRESSLRVLLGSWLGDGREAVLLNEIAALNVVSLLEVLALNEPPESLEFLEVLQAFATHPISEVAELSKLSFCQIQDIKKIRIQGLPEQRGLSLLNAFDRWHKPTN